MCRWGQIARPVNMSAVARQVYRPDLYRAAAQRLGLPAPASEIKTEGDSGQRVEGEFFGGEHFDPAQAEAYLAGFAIRHTAPAAEAPPPIAG
jgi:nitrate/nitrite transport system substrate-binding protein